MVRGRRSEQVIAIPAVDKIEAVGDQRIAAIAAEEPVRAAAAFDQVVAALAA
jgi:hypothetical protein